MSMHLGSVLMAFKHGIISTSVKLQSPRLKTIVFAGGNRSFYSAKPCTVSNNKALLLCNATNNKCHLLNQKRQIQTEGDKALTDFLEKEIAAESKNKKSLNKIDSFEIATQGSDVTLTKKSGDEIILVKMNVNHSVDAEEPEEEDVTPKQQNSQEQEVMGEMKSKPSFVVEITKQGKTLAISCSFPAYNEEAMEDNNNNNNESYNDAFEISELSIYEGESKEQNYSVAGEIMDGFLYDLLMNMLEERGISNEFAEQLIDYCTAYEHSLYIDFLQKLKGFSTK